MDKVTFLKHAIEFVVSTSVGAVVKNVVKHTAPFNQSIPNQILTGIGGFVISMVVSEHCTNYIEAQLFKSEPEKETDNGHRN